jgi:hypothetical protein
MKDASVGQAPSMGWITSRDAARRLGIGTRELYEFIDGGALAAYHVEGDLVLRPEDVAAYRRRPPA